MQVTPLYPVGARAFRPGAARIGQTERRATLLGDDTLQFASEEVPIDLLLVRHRQDATATARFGSKTGTTQVMRLQAEDGQPARS